MTRSIWLALLVLFALASGVEMAPAQQSGKPNIVYFLVDNLGMGELSSYSGGPLRGTYTLSIDALAKEGMRLRAGDAMYAGSLCAHDWSVFDPLW
jgi:arylsulfatase A-like enzyme